MNAKILVLEDEIGIRSFIKINLKREGYEVIESSNSNDALDKIENENISIALLDIMIEGEYDGLYVCKKLRQKYENIGIIMLTAKGQEQDKLKGFEYGADDYIIKPFSPKELLARISTLLRRVQRQNSAITNFIRSNIFCIDLEQKKIFKNKVEIDITPTEYEILKLLIVNENKSISRDFILDEVWGKNYIGDLKIVDVNIRRIRSKIEDDSSKPKYIQTVWGTGYCWKNNENVK